MHCGRTTLNHYSFSVIVIVPVKKQSDFLVISVSSESLQLSILPCYDLIKSCMPPEHSEYGKITNFAFHGKVDPQCRNMAKMSFQA